MSIYYRYVLTVLDSVFKIQLKSDLTGFILHSEIRPGPDLGQKLLHLNVIDFLLPKSSNNLKLECTVTREYELNTCSNLLVVTPV